MALTITPRSMFRAFAYALIGTLGLLTIPLVLTWLNPSASIHGGAGGGWDWTLSDFVIAGLVLLTIGFVTLLAVLALRQRRSRLIAVISGLTLLLVVWAELAVGGVSQIVALVS